MSKDIVSCPACDSLFIRYDKEKDSYECVKCGTIFIIESKGVEQID